MNTDLFLASNSIESTDDIGPKKVIKRQVRPVNLKRLDLRDLVDFDDLEEEMATCELRTKVYGGKYQNNELDAA